MGDELDAEMRVALNNETVDADETLDRFGIDSLVRPDFAFVSLAPCV
jgi:hypothetical protein